MSLFDAFRYDRKRAVVVGGASGMGAARPEWLDQWKRWPDLAANAHGNLFFIPPDIVQRHTPRILDGASQLCEQLESVRARRAERSPAAPAPKN